MSLLSAHQSLSSALSVPVIRASDYQCTVCRELLLHPVTLSCTHRYCCHCLMQVAASNALPTVPHSQSFVAGAGPVCHCVACRKPFAYDLQVLALSESEQKEHSSTSASAGLHIYAFPPQTPDPDAELGMANAAPVEVDRALSVFLAQHFAVESQRRRRATIAARTKLFATPNPASAAATTNQQSKMDPTALSQLKAMGALSGAGGSGNGSGHQSCHDSACASHTVLLSQRIAASEPVPLSSDKVHVSRAVLTSASMWVVSC